MKRKASIILVKIVGTGCLAFSVFGFVCALLISILMFSRGTYSEHPYFIQSFILMLLVCGIFKWQLFIYGRQFWRLDLRKKKKFMGLLLAEVGYLIIIGLNSVYKFSFSGSIAATSGINLGILSQLAWGFILWAPILLWIAGRHLAKTEASTSLQPPAFSSV